MMIDDELKIRDIDEIREISGYSRLKALENPR